MQKNFIPNKQLFGFCFQLHNISKAALYSYDKFDQRNVLWKRNSINKYIDFLIKRQPEYIVGFGIFSRVMKIPFIKIEEITCIKTKAYRINHFLKPYKHSVFSKTIGKSYCNYVSFQIMDAIKNGRLNSRYTFLHIPKNMDISEIKDEIDHLLSNY